MTVRIWLNTAGTKALETKQENKYGKTEEVSRLNGIEIHKTQGGEEYADLHIDPIDPASSAPAAVDRKYVKRVTFVDTYYEGFRTDGIYKLKGATARVESQRQYRGSFDLDNQTEDSNQTISISAGSIRTLREIYSKVRTAELKPAEDWGINKYDLDQRTREAAKKVAAEVPTEH